jgi:hypothetical protein
VSSAKPKRERSPNYPAIGLVSAIELAGRIYQSERRNPTPRARAMDLMGFKSVTGAAQANLSALKKYGLLADHGALVRVSDEAHRLLAYPDGSEERAQIERELSTRPVLFREILRAFPDGLPGADRLRGYLVAELGFTDTAASILVRVLNETFRERLQVPSRNVCGGSSLSEAVQDQVTQNAVETVDSEDGVAAMETRGARLAADRSAPHPVVWYVGSGINVEIRSNLPLKAKHFRLLAKYVNLAAEAAELEESTTGQD